MISQKSFFLRWFFFLCFDDFKAISNAFWFHEKTSFWKPTLNTMNSRKKSFSLLLQIFFHILQITTAFPIVRAVRNLDISYFSIIEILSLKANFLKSTLRLLKHHFISESITDNGGNLSFSIFTQNLCSFLFRSFLVSALLNPFSIVVDWVKPKAKKDSFLQNGPQ